ncbi:hypothetical protein [Streptomyces venetus]|uniref:hypothetical protein n=1 Tax=Streptomyces venetus TaxID=1701086 RepID=UPI003C2CEA5C
MSDLQSCPATGTSGPPPAYPLPRAAECPPAPAPAAPELRSGKPVTREPVRKIVDDRLVGR